MYAFGGRFGSVGFSSGYYGLHGVSALSALRDNTFQSAGAQNDDGGDDMAMSQVRFVRCAWPFHAHTLRGGSSLRGVRSE